MPATPPPAPLRPFARPALVLATALGVGIVLATAGLPLRFWIAVLIGWIAVAMLITWQTRKRLVTLRGLLFALAVVGATVAAGGARMAGWQTLPPNHLVRAAEAAQRAEDRGGSAEAMLCGVVIRPSEVLAYGTRLRVRVDSVATANASQPVHGTVQVLLGQPRFAEQPLVYPAVLPGDRVRLTGRLEPVPPRRNPADFNYGAYLRRQNVHATMALYDAEAITFLGSEAGARTRLVNAARGHVEDALARFVRRDDARAVLRALLLADRAEIDAETRETFARTGLMHLLAVSGLHVLLVGLLLYRLLKPVLGRLGFGWRTVELSRAAVTLALLFLYVQLTGGTVSVQRAFIMAAVWILGTVVQRPSDTLNTLGVAAIMVLLIRPAALFDVGFQLSFAAVGAIVTLVPLFEGTLPHRWRAGRVRGWLVGMVTVSLAATLGTAPVVLYHFGRLPLAGLVLNLAAIPVTAAVLLGGIGCAVFAGWMPWAADAFAAVAELASQGLLALSREGAARLDWTLVEGYVRDLWLVLALTAGLVALALWRRPRMRWRLSSAMLGCCVLSIWLGLARGDTQPQLDVVFLDVGQGDATLLAFPSGQHVLVDAGVRTPYSDQGTRTVVPHLERFGIDRLDALVLTHPDADHIGGAFAVLEAVTVGRLVHAGPQEDGAMWQALLHFADSLGVPQQTVHAGDTLALDPAVRLRVLGPDGPPPPWLDRNEGSVVLRAEYGATSVLLTGDAEVGAESALVARYGDALASTVVKVGHHGSRTSSIPAFVDAASDSSTVFAVVSVARRNRYGLPDEEPLARWDSTGAQVLQTAHEGALWLRSDGKQVMRVDWR
ncbi:MAG: DNA internalization-related competence protein ComEC/Rec2 [Rhodothermaceae bacterium]|nr:DNA internalization-related competence protein ComEC/Rec2 [Rhodothermaceae bacterium]